MHCANSPANKKLEADMGTPPRQSLRLGSHLLKRRMGYRQSATSLPRPQRILIVSADMGEGHNAAGRALEATARRIWPDCSTYWVDTLDAMVRGVGPSFRRIYVVNIEKTPWLYDY